MLAVCWVVQAKVKGRELQEEGEARRRERGVHCHGHQYLSVLLIADYRVDGWMDGRGGKEKMGKKRRRENRVINKTLTFVLLAPRVGNDKRSAVLFGRQRARHKAFDRFLGEE